MIAGDKNLLKATLTQGVLQIQITLIELYNNNINALATGTTMMASFAYTGLAEAVYPHSDHVINEGLMYFYYFFNNVSLAVGIFCIAQATIVTMFGPSLALNGDTPETVTSAVNLMEQEQRFIFRIAAGSVICLMIAACLLGWARLDYGIAGMDTILYLIAIYLMVVEGKKVYEMFKLDEAQPAGVPSSAVNRYRDMGVSIKQMSMPSGSGASVVGGSGPRSVAGGSVASKADLDARSVVSGMGTVVNASAALDAANTKARGIIFWRGSLSSGGRLREVYAVLEKGKLDFYKSQKDFENNNNPLNVRPFRLWEYVLEKDISKFTRDVLGQTDFTLAQVMTSQYALREAARKYKFALMPKIFSELAVLDVVELMATDEEAYRLWTMALKRTIRGHEELGGRDAVIAASQPMATRQTIRVENAIEAANATQGYVV